MTRQLITLRTIKSINPIPDADSIEVLTIDGWKVVARKGEFAVGERVFYFEVDCFLPKADPRFEFLMKSGVRTFEENEGHVLRTVRLRKQISQGLVQKLSVFPEIVNPVEDVDYSGAINVKKWEPNIDPSLAGQVKGAFPHFIMKTDQERCQNLETEIFTDNANSTFEVSLKLDGMSVTFYSHNGDTGVCTRNLELKINEENAQNTLVRLFVDSGLQEKIGTFGNIAIQGELMGPKIQNNREKFTKPTFFVFDIQDLDSRTHVSTLRRNEILNELAASGIIISHVPILHDKICLSELSINTVDDLLNFAEGPSITNPVREGLVFKRSDGEFSFKAISNKFLLKAE